MAFQISEFENEIIEYRDDDGKIERLIAIVKSNDFREFSDRQQSELAKLLMWREKSTNEDIACHYEHLLLTLRNHIEVAANSDSAEEEVEEPKRVAKEGDVRMVWSGLQKFDGKEWVSSDDKTDEDLEMESGYESHRTKEGMRQ